MKYYPILLLICLAIMSCRKEDAPQPCELVQTAIITTPKWEIPFGQPGNDSLDLLFYAQWTPLGILANRTNHFGQDTLMLLDPDSGKPVWHLNLFNTLEPEVRAIKLDNKNALVLQDHLLIGYRSYLHVIDLATGALVTHALGNADFDGFGQSPHLDRFWFSTRDCPGSDIVYSVYESDIKMSFKQTLKTDTFPGHAFSDSYYNITGWNAPDGETYLFVRMVENSGGHLSLIMYHPATKTEIWRKEKTGNRSYSMSSTQVFVSDDRLFVHNSTTDQLTSFKLPEGETLWSISSTGVFGRDHEWIYAATSGLSRIHMATGMTVPLFPSLYNKQFAGLNSAYTYFIDKGHCIAIRNTGGCNDLIIEHPIQGRNGFWSTIIFHADPENRQVFLTDFYSLYAFDLP